MKHIILSSILLLTGCFKYYPPEKAAFEFDNRKWILANSDIQPGKSLYEYTPQGQNSRNWTETLGTVFLASNISTSAKYELQKLFSTINRICENTSTSILEETESEITYHWSIRNCSRASDQHEIGRFIETNSGVHKVSYVRKTTELGIIEKEYWLSNIKGTQIVESHDKTQAILNGISIGILNIMNLGY